MEQTMNNIESRLIKGIFLLASGIIERRLRTDKYFSQMDMIKRKRNTIRRARIVEKLLMKLGYLALCDKVDRNLRMFRPQMLKHSPHEGFHLPSMNREIFLSIINRNIQSYEEGVLGKPVTFLF